MSCSAQPGRLQLSASQYLLPGSWLVESTCRLLQPRKAGKLTPFVTAAAAAPLGPGAPEDVPDVP